MPAGRTLTVAALAIAALGAGSPWPQPPAQPQPPLSIEINVPAYRLDVRDGDTTWSYRVAVGQRRYPTPIGRFGVSEVVWNPWWVPPASDWARDERTTPPGADNPMGQVKLRITELVFVHGTPLVGSLGTAGSHACVRMANADAIAVARRVHRRATPALTDAAIDSILADSTHSRRFAVAPPVPVIVRYDLAEVLRDSLWIYPNVYALRTADPRAHAMRALAGVGVDTATVDATALRDVLRAGRRQVAGVPMAVVAPVAPANGER